jgi:hypothetical protein
MWRKKSNVSATERHRIVARTLVDDDLFDWIGPGPEKQALYGLEHAHTPPNFGA